MIINPVTLKSVSPIAEALSEKGIYLKSMPGGILDGIDAVIEANLAALLTTNAEAFIGDASIPAKYALSNIGNGEDLAEGISSDIENLVVKKITNDISFAKNVIKPAIEEAAAEIIDKYNKALNTEVQNKALNIEVITYPKILEDMDFEESISDTPSPNEAAISRGRLSLGHISTDTVRKMVSNTIIPYVDTEIVQEWLDNISESELRDILDTYFTEISPTNQAYSDLRSEINVGIGDKVMSIFIIAHAFANNQPQEHATDAQNYKRVMVNVIDYMRSILRVIRNIMRSRVEAGILIAGVQHNKVYVYGPVMDKYISTKIGDDETPSVDAILGSAVSTDMEKYYTKIIENHDKYVETWKKYVNVWNSQVKLRFGKELTTIIYSVISEHAKHVDSWEQTMRDESGYVYGEVMRNLEEELTGLDVEEFLHEPYEEAIELVLKFRFPYAPGGKIFKIAEEISEEHNGELDAETVMSIAIIRYLVSFLMERVLFIPNNG